MERIIKFRGKDLIHNEWIFGGIATDGKNNIVILPKKDWSKGGCVDESTVGQFTGMYDKYRKEIYENDIVEAWSQGQKAIGLVKQRKDGLWLIYPAWQNGDFWCFKPDEYGHDTVEVIGNIHDNPELLKHNE